MRKLTFTNSRDETLELGYYTNFLLNSIEGLGEVEADIDTIVAPYIDGATYIDTKLNSRDIAVEGTFRKMNSPELYNNRRRLQRIFNPKLGLGKLRYEDEGVIRVIDAIADGSPVFAEKGEDLFQKFQITLLCPDPYWRDTSEVSRLLTAYHGYFTVPFTLPFKLGKQGDRTTLLNDGDIPTPVTISLHGPVTNPIIENQTTGEFIKVNISVASNEILNINTAPRRKRIEIYNNGSIYNAFGNIAFAEGASFWELETGTNDIAFYADTGNRDGAVTIAWSNLYTGI